MIYEYLETNRLKLRKVVPEVFTYIFENEPDESIKSFLGIHTDQELEKEKQKYHKGLSTYNKSFLYFQLINKETNAVMGWCGFHTWYLDHGRAEIGYILNAEAFRGKRYMSEAIVPIIDYGFEIMKLNRIEAFLSPQNVPSLQLLKQLKFTQEGYLREHYNDKGQLQDSLLYALLRAEYK